MTEFLVGVTLEYKDTIQYKDFILPALLSCPEELVFRHFLLLSNLT
jgi:hypothetical protein